MCDADPERLPNCAEGANGVIGELTEFERR